MKRIHLLQQTFHTFSYRGHHGGPTETPPTINTFKDIRCITLSVSQIKLPTLSIIERLSRQ